MIELEPERRPYFTGCMEKVNAEVNAIWFRENTARIMLDAVKEKPKIEGFKMNIIGWVMVVVAVVLAVGLVYNLIYASYEWEKSYGSYWSLAEKAATIKGKSEYVDKFVESLESANLHGQYNAYFMNTPDNSFDGNMLMLQTLQSRLHEIKNMDAGSFQYQTAVQQITAQEQGEAHDMITTLKDIWYKDRHFFLWEWNLMISIFAILVLGSVGFGLAVEL